MAILSRELLVFYLALSGVSQATLSCFVSPFSLTACCWSDRLPRRLPVDQREALRIFFGTYQDNQLSSLKLKNLDSSLMLFFFFFFSEQINKTVEKPQEIPGKNPRKP